nr:MAG: polyprotein [Ciborinia camelliae endornavirus 1]
MAKMMGSENELYCVPKIYANGEQLCYTNNSERQDDGRIYFNRAIAGRFAWVQGELEKISQLKEDDDFSYSPPANIPHNIEDVIKNVIESQLYTAGRIFSTFATEGSFTQFVRRKITTHATTLRNVTQISLPSMAQRLKATDVLFVKVGHSWAPAVIRKINKSNGDIFLNGLSITDMEVQVIILNQSVGSLWRTLFSFMNMPHQDQLGSHVNKLISSASCTIGTAGAGKTRAVADLIKHGDRAIGMTTGSIHSFASKGIPSRQIMTVEASNMDGGFIDNLFVDEATTIDYIELLPTLARVKGKLHLYGDKNQISRKDMSITPGIRYNTNITKRVTGAITYLTKSYRVGMPAARYLKGIVSEFDTHNEHETTYNATYIGVVDYELCAKHINASNIDKVFVFNDHSRVKLYDAGITNAHTIHSTQGDEGNRIAVVYSPDGSGSYQLAQNPEYLFAALTRGKFHIELVVLGYHENTTDLGRLCRKAKFGTNISTLKIDDAWRWNEEEMDDAERAYNEAGHNYQFLRAGEERVVILENTDSGVHSHLISSHGVQVTDEYEQLEEFFNHDDGEPPLTLSGKVLGEEQSKRFRNTLDVGITRSALEHLTKYHKEQRPAGIKAVDLEFNDHKEISIANMYLASDSAIEAYNKSPVSHEGIPLIITRKADATIATIKKMGMGAVITNINGELEVTGTHRDNVMNMKSKWAQPLLVSAKEQGKRIDIKLSTEKESSIRFIAWILDMIINTESIELLIDGVITSVRKTAGCPYYCGLIFWKADEEVIVTGHFRSHTRRALVSNNGETALQKAVMNWLNNTHDMTTTTAFLDAEVPRAVSDTQLLERIKHSKDFMLQLVTLSKDRCVENRTSSIMHAAAVAKECDLDMRQDYVTYVRHNSVCTVSGLRQSHQLLSRFRVAKSQRHKVKLSVHSQGKTVKFNLNEMRDVLSLVKVVLNDIDLARERTNKPRYGAGESHLSLGMSLSAHIKEKTKLGLAYMKDNSVMLGHTIVNHEDLVRLSVEATKQLADSSLLKYFDFSYTQSGWDPQAPVIVEAYDAFMLSTFDKHYTQSTYTYVTAYPAILACNSKYHLQYEVPQDTNHFGPAIQSNEQLYHELRTRAAVNDIKEREHSSTVVCGITTMGLQMQHVEYYTNKYKNVYITMAKPRPSPSTLYNEPTRRVIAMDTVVYPGQTELEKKLTTGISVQLSNGLAVRALPIVTMSEWTMYRLETCANIPAYDVINSETTGMGTTTTTVILPMLTVDVTELARGKPLLTRQQIIIDTKLLRMIMLRQLANPVSVADLKVFVKSMVTTIHLGTEIGYNTEHIGLDVIMATAYVAHLLHNDTHAAYTELIGFLNKVKSKSNLAAANMPGILDTVNSLFTEIVGGIDVQKFIELGNEWLKQLDVGMEIADVTACFDSVRKMVATREWNINIINNHRVIDKPDSTNDDDTEIDLPVPLVNQFHMGNRDPVTSAAMRTVGKHCDQKDRTAIYSTKMQTVLKSSIGIQQQADIIRFEILKDHGEWWLDSGSFLAKPINYLPHDPQKVFVFERPGGGIEIGCIYIPQHLKHKLTDLTATVSQMMSLEHSTKEVRRFVEDECRPYGTLKPYGGVDWYLRYTIMFHNWLNKNEIPYVTLPSLEYMYKRASHIVVSSMVTDPVFTNFPLSHFGDQVIIKTIRFERNQILKYRLKYVPDSIADLTNRQLDGMYRPDVYKAILVYGTQGDISLANVLYDIDKSYMIVGPRDGNYLEEDNVVRYNTSIADTSKNMENMHTGLAGWLSAAKNAAQDNFALNRLPTVVPMLTHVKVPFYFPFGASLEQLKKLWPNLQYVETYGPIPLDLDIIRECKLSNSWLGATLPKLWAYLQQHNEGPIDKSKHTVITVSGMYNRTELLPSTLIEMDAYRHKAMERRPGQYLFMLGSMPIIPVIPVIKHIINELGKRGCRLHVSTNALNVAGIQSATGLSAEYCHSWVDYRNIKEWAGVFITASLGTLHAIMGANVVAATIPIFGDQFPNAGILNKLYHVPTINKIEDVSGAIDNMSIVGPDLSAYTGGEWPLMRYSTFQQMLRPNVNYEYTQIIRDGTDGQHQGSGQFIFDASLRDILYEPANQSSLYCAYNCLKVTAPTQLSVIGDYNRPTLEINQIETACFKLGINLALFDDKSSTAIAKIWWPDRQTLVLHDTPISDSLHHVSIVQIDVDSNLRRHQRALAIQPPDELSIEDTNRDFNDTTMIDANVQARITLKNLHHVTNYTAMSAGSLIQLPKPNRYVIDVQIKLGTILAAIGNEYIDIGVVVASSESRSSVKVYGPNREHHLYCTLRSSITKRPKGIKTVVDDNLTTTAINLETKQYLISQGRQLEVEGIYDQGDKNYALVITNFDNRDHHSLNVSQALMNAHTVNTISPHDSELVRTLRASTNKNPRTIMHDDALYYWVQANSRITANIEWICAQFNIEVIHVYGGIAIVKSESNVNVYESVFKPVHKGKGDDPWDSMATLVLGDHVPQELTDTLDEKLATYEYYVKTQMTTGGMKFELGDNKLEVGPHFSTKYMLNLVMAAPKHGKSEQAIPHRAGVKENWSEEIAPGGSLSVNTKKQTTELTDKVTEPVHDVMAWTIHTLMSIPNLVIAEQETPDDEIHNVETLPLTIDTLPILITYDELVPLHVIDFWQNTDLTWHVKLLMPRKGVMSTRERPQRMMTMTKHTLEKFPIFARPVFTKMALEEQRAIAFRLHTVEEIRTVTPDVDEVFADWCQAYLGEGWQAKAAAMREHPVSYSAHGTQAWLNEHPKTLEKQEALITLLTEGGTTKPINDVNVHMKLESLLKDTPYDNILEHKARLIVWQEYAIAALFSPIFLELKNRLKQLLRDNVVYADGTTPEQLAQIVSNVGSFHGYFENDLTKQDRQTDRPLLDVEDRIYLLLGIDENALSLWRLMHIKWRYRGSYTKGYGDEMRLSGQATTALGNLITNMQVHAKFVKKNIGRILLLLFLGDDSNFICKLMPDQDYLRGYIATRFNMEAKDEYDTNDGAFISMLLTRDRYGNAMLCPDIIRLSRRFEVTNGVHEVSSDMLVSRAQSYLTMLGKNDFTDAVNKRMGWNLDLHAYYDLNSALEAAGRRYKTGTVDAEAHLARLLKNIEQPCVVEHTWQAMGSKPYRH